MLRFTERVGIGVRGVMNHTSITIQYLREGLRRPKKTGCINTRSVGTMCGTSKGDEYEM